MEFTTLTNSHCNETDSIHYFVFKNDSKPQIGIGFIEEFVGFPPEVILLCTENGLCLSDDSVSVEDVLLVSVEPFKLPTAENALLNFTRLSDDLPENGTYFVLSCEDDYDIDVDDCGRNVGAPNGASIQSVHLGLLSKSHDPDDFPLEFNGFTELSSLSADESFRISHYSKFEWPTYSAD